MFGFKQNWTQINGIRRSHTIYQWTWTHPGPEARQAYFISLLPSPRPEFTLNERRYSTPKYFHFDIFVHSFGHFWCQFMASSGDRKDRSEGKTMRFAQVSSKARTVEQLDSFYFCVPFEFLWIFSLGPKSCGNLLFRGIEKFSAPSEPTRAQNVNMEICRRERMPCAGLSHSLFVVSSSLFRGKLKVGGCGRSRWSMAVKWQLLFWRK